MQAFHEQIFGFGWADIVLGEPFTAAVEKLHKKNVLRPVEYREGFALANLCFRDIVLTDQVAYVGADFKEYPVANMLPHRCTSNFQVFGREDGKVFRISIRFEGNDHDQNVLALLDRMPKARVIVRYSDPDRRRVNYWQALLGPVTVCGMIADKAHVEIFNADMVLERNQWWPLVAVRDVFSHILFACLD